MKKITELDPAVIADTVAACKGTAVDKLFLLVVLMFRSLGLNIADFPATLNTDLLPHLVDITKIWAAPDTSKAKKALRPIAADAYRGFTTFMLMTALDRHRFNALPVAERIQLFKQVLLHLHYGLQIDLNGFLFSTLRYAADTDITISDKGRTLFFVLSRSDFENYKEGLV